MISEVTNTDRLKKIVFKMWNGKKSKSQNTETWKKSSISRKYPSYRNSLLISIEGWLKGKQTDDGAEGLWRIHDTLYDFTKFIDRHPGGSFWLAQTKGTDITEPFESHHISTLPERMLEKYVVRKAKEPRNYNLTLHENGFYRTLKGRVREKLREIDQRPINRTNLLHLALLLATLVFTMASAMFGWTILEITAALSLCWLAIASHNYFHKRDNWQMYAFNVSLLNFNDWRISHALSHHVYPNSLHDLEMSMFEPFLCWIPNVHLASKLHRIISVVIQPILYSLVFPFSFLTRLVASLLIKNILYWHDTIGFVLPLLMMAFSEAPVHLVLRQWFFILSMSSFMFGVIGLNAAHHGPTIHHDGDANRPDRDWGLFQVDTIIDRSDIRGSQFLVLTHFGDHALHHLFPTLDHGILPQLYPVFLQTLQEFQVDWRSTNHLGHIVGQSQQLLRTEPNPVPPGGLLKSR